MLSKEKNNISCEWFWRRVANIRRDVVWNWWTFFSSLSYFFRRRTGKPTVHVIGDSHVFAFGGDPLFCVHHLGPATAYNLIKKDSTTRSNEKFFNILNKIDHKNDCLILLFGEIDCRIHIYYQFKKNQEKFTLEKLVEKTILNYGEIMKVLKNKGVKFFVHGGVPASKQENVYKFKYYAPPEVRSLINRLYNAQLKSFCLKRGYPFLDIYPMVSDNKGFITEEYWYDDVHLNRKVKQLVKKMLPEGGYFQ